MNERKEECKTAIWLSIIPTDPLVRYFAAPTALDSHLEHVLNVSRLDFEECSRVGGTHCKHGASEY